MLLVHGTAGHYGADRSLLLLAQSLRERGWEVSVAIGADGPLVDDLRAAGVPVTRIEAGVPRRVYGRSDWLRFAFATLPRSVAQVARMARRVDVVHLNTSAMLGALVGAKLGRARVITHLRESWSHQPRAWSVYGRLVGRWSAAVIANSAAVAAEMDSVGFAAKVRVVHNGIEFRPPRPADRRPQSIVMVGRINEGKGQSILIDALADLAASGLNATATIAGDVFPGGDHFLHELEAHIARQGVGDRVSLPGFVEDVDGLFATHEVFVLPSVRPEGFGLVLIEAMAQGIPCIATAAGGPTEIVRDGETGLLVPPGDVAALAAAMRKLLADSAARRSLGERGAADVRERFSAERTVSGVEGVYREVLG